MSFTVLCLLAVFLTGCSPKVITQTEYKTDIQYRDSWRTDSVYVRDSIFIRERGDTVYVDRWHTAWRDREVVRTDTVMRCDTVRRETVRRERYVPGFYKGSTIALWVLVAVLLVYGGFRIYRRLRG